MVVKNIVDEDFVNYKKPSMFIGCHSCSFKCDQECGKPVCQNGALAAAPDVEIAPERIAERFMRNKITSAVVFGGLEPFDDIMNVMRVIAYIRIKESLYGGKADIVIYTGYTLPELYEKYGSELLALMYMSPLYIKHGRFVYGQQPHFDDELGVYLSSDNQRCDPIEHLAQELGCKSLLDVINK